MEPVRLLVVPDLMDATSVHVTLTLGHEQGQQQQQQQQAPAGSHASSDQPKKVKKAKRVADDELACSWIMSHPWVVYTGKRSPAGHRYATCSCCTEDNPGESKFGCEGEGAVVTRAISCATRPAEAM